MTDEWSDDVLVRYLLRELDDPTLDALEAQIIESAAVQAQLAAVEAELVDDYVAERLPLAARRRFEASYFSDAHGVQKVEFARTLRRALPAASLQAPWRRTWRRARMPLAASLLVALALSRSQWWMPGAADRSPREDGHQVVNGAVPVGQPGSITRPEVKPESTIETSPSRPGLTPLAGGTVRTGAEQPSFVLVPGGARALRASQTIAVSADVRIVHLRLTGLDTGAVEKYHAVLMNPDADATWQAPPLVVRGDGELGMPLTLLDISHLRSGDYVVHLSARTPDGKTQDVADYTFRLVKAR